MRIDLTQYQEHYHDKKNKLIDNWQEGVRILPFTSNTSSAVDRECGLSGASGAFFRMLEPYDIQAIENFKETENIVRDHLVNHKNMDPHQAEEFISMLRDIMQVNGSLNVTDVAFLKYIPLVPEGDAISDKNKKKYRAGITKLASLLRSMVGDDFTIPIHDGKNLFVRILNDALTGNDDSFGTKNRNEESYFVLPFIRNSFVKDLDWMMKEKSSVIVRYIHLLLHFYICHILMQTMPRLSYKQREPDRLFNYYFILKSERASANHDAVRTWKENLPKDFLDKIFGRSQALDIINCVLGGNVGFYNDILASLEQTPFDENKSDCEELLRLYQEEKREVFRNRNSESDSIEEMDITVNSYEEFLYKLEELCKRLQSQSYVSRMRKKAIDVLSMRLLQIRRGNYVPVLDNEMLVFLAAMVTKGERTKLEDMYKGFNNYGIFFNRATRTAIETYLLKLNLLDRKSDSGEAQYVKVIL